jgi:hypothetical protein
MHLRNILFFAMTTLLVLNIAQAQPTRPGMQSNAILLIDGKFEANLTSMEGGNLVAEVMEQRVPGEILVKKQIANTKIEDLKLTFRGESGLSVFDWMNAVLEGKNSAKMINIMTCDLNGNMLSNKEYLNVLPVEFKLSQFDGAAKELVNVFLTIKPASLRDGAVSGKCATAIRGKKSWLSSNFRFELNGVETKMTRSVEDLSVKFSLAKEQTGNSRLPSEQIAKIAVSNFSVKFSSTEKKGWLDWFNTFVVEGRSSEQDEKDASIVLLSMDMKTEVARIKLEQVGIFRLSEVPATADRIGFSQADLYAEKVIFEAK